MTSSTSGVPRTNKEVYAEALRLAWLEFCSAQEALKTDDTNEARARYAQALNDFDRLSAAFPFVSAGVTDAMA